MISLSARRPDPSSPFLQQDHLFRPKSIARAYSVQCVQCTPNCFHIFHSVSTSKSLPIGPKRIGKYLLSFLYLKLRASCPWPTSVSDFRAIIYLPILSPIFSVFSAASFLAPAQPRLKFVQRISAAPCELGTEPLSCAHQNPETLTFETTSPARCSFVLFCDFWKQLAQVDAPASSWSAVTIIRAKPQRQNASAHLCHNIPVLKRWLKNATDCYSTSTHICCSGWDFCSDFAPSMPKSLFLHTLPMQHRKAESHLIAIDWPVAV